MLGLLLACGLVVPQASNDQARLTEDLDSALARIESLQAQTWTATLKHIRSSVTRASHNVPKTIAWEIAQASASDPLSIQVATWSGGRLVGFGLIKTLDNVANGTIDIHKPCSIHHTLGFYWDGVQGLRLKFSARTVLLLRRRFPRPFQLWPDQLTGQYSSFSVVALLRGAKSSGKLALRRDGGRLIATCRSPFNDREPIEFGFDLRNGLRQVTLTLRDEQCVLFERTFYYNGGPLPDRVVEKVLIPLESGATEHERRFLVREFTVTEEHDSLTPDLLLGRLADVGILYFRGRMVATPEGLDGTIRRQAGRFFKRHLPEPRTLTSTELFDREVRLCRARSGGPNWPRIDEARIISDFDEKRLTIQTKEQYCCQASLAFMSHLGVPRSLGYFLGKEPRPRIPFRRLVKLIEEEGWSFHPVRMPSTLIPHLKNPFFFVAKSKAANVAHLLVAKSLPEEPDRVRYWSSPGRLATASIRGLLAQYPDSIVLASTEDAGRLHGQAESHTTFRWLLVLLSLACLLVVVVPKRAKRHTRVVVFLLLAAAVACDKSYSPKVVLRNQMISVKVPYREQAASKVMIRNEGNRELQVRPSIASCSCISSPRRITTIEPHSEGVLCFSIEGQTPGLREEAIRFSTNDPSRRTFLVKFRVLVGPALYTRPSRIGLNGSVGSPIKDAFEVFVLGKARPRKVVIDCKAHDIVFSISFGRRQVAGSMTFWVYSVSVVARPGARSQTHLVGITATRPNGTSVTIEKAVGIGLSG